MKCSNCTNRNICLEEGCDPTRCDGYRKEPKRGTEPSLPNGGAETIKPTGSKGGREDRFGTPGYESDELTGELYT